MNHETRIIMSEYCSYSVFKHQKCYKSVKLFFAAMRQNKNNLNVCRQKRQNKKNIAPLISLF